MRTGIATAVALVTVLGSAGLPRPALAGQKEWANAGKILTGVVVGGVAVHWLDSRPVHTETREVVTVRSYPAPCPPPRPAYCPPPRYEYCPPPRPAYCPPRECEPLIIQTASDRRLYQAGGHGAPAYVQVWSEVECRWISIEEIPSLR